MNFELTISPGELDLDRCLFSGQVFRWRKRPDGSYEGIDGRNLYTIRRTNGIVQIDTTASRAAIDDFFNLGVDIVNIADKILTVSPELESHIGALRGLRIMRPSDPTEVFFSFLCTANNHLKRITPMIAKLAGYGERIEGSELHFFPRVSTVAAIRETELRAFGFGYRGATIPYAAVEAAKRGGDDWLTSLQAVGYEEAHRELVSIKGIGHKLADCICLYGLHYEEAVPIDTHLWQAACRVFFPQHAGLALTEKRYREVGDFFRDRFGRFAGWAHLYLYYENMLRGRSVRDVVRRDGL
ncbi:MAG TPA: DNA glycosylase [Fimbriimonadaceae bacterium]|nr:DNA glycosylase [Fimbriimonadaceae bacterium]